MFSTTNTQKKNIRLKRSIKQKITSCLKTLLIMVISLIGAIGMIAMIFGASIQEQDKLTAMAAVEVRND